MMTLSEYRQRERLGSSVLLRFAGYDEIEPPGVPWSSKQLAYVLMRGDLNQFGWVVYRYTPSPNSVGDATWHFHTFDEAMEFFMNDALFLLPGNLE